MKERPNGLEERPDGLEVKGWRSGPPQADLEDTGGGYLAFSLK